MGSKSKIMQLLASGAAGVQQALKEVHAHKPAALVTFNVGTVRVWSIKSSTSAVMFYAIDCIAHLGPWLGPFMHIYIFTGVCLASSTRPKWRPL